jgi:hypothetical protein
MRAQLQGLESRRLLILLGKVAVASGALLAVCAASSRWLLADWPTQPLVTKLVALAGTVLAGVGVFGACGIGLRIEELQQLKHAVARRLRR